MIYLDKSTDQQAVYIPKDEYTGTPGGHTAILQSKDWEITQNGITRVAPDAGYDGISGGSITVYVNSDTATTFERLTTTENGQYVPTGNSAYSAVTVNVDLETPYQEGYAAGEAAGYSSGLTIGYAEGEADQKAKLTDLNVTVNGQYSREDGYKKVTVNVPGGGINQTKNITASTNGEMTITYDNGYTGLERVNLLVDVPTGSTINNQTKTVSITRNSTYNITYDSGYTGLEEVNLNVDVSANTSVLSVNHNGTWYARQDGYDGYHEVNVNVDMTPAYNSGYTEGYTSGETDGYASGVTYQKSLLTSTTITDNGTYTKEDGWNEVDVNVQPVLTGITATTNGAYYPPSGVDGFHSVEVYVPATPTQSITPSVGITMVWPPASSVTCYGSSTQVSDWTQILSETGVTIDKWWMLDFEGWGNGEAGGDLYPKYNNPNKLRYAVDFEEQLPYVKSLYRFFFAGYQTNSIRHIKIYDPGALVEDIQPFYYLDFTSFCEHAPYLQDVEIRNKGFNPAYGRFEVRFDGAFAETPITSATITATLGDGYAVEMFRDCTALTYVNLSSCGFKADSDCLRIFSGCTALETIQGFVGAFDYRTINNSNNPFYNLPALVNVDPNTFYYLGEMFYMDPTGDHTVDLSISTGLSHDSLVAIINNIHNVGSTVSNAQLILGATNLAKLSAAEQAIAINKGWALS